MYLYWFLFQDLQGSPLKAVIKDNKYQDYNALRDKVYNIGLNQNKETETTDTVRSGEGENVVDSSASR